MAIAHVESVVGWRKHVFLLLSVSALLDHLNLALLRLVLLAPKFFKIVDKALAAVVLDLLGLHHLVAFPRSRMHIKAIENYSLQAFLTAVDSLLAEVLPRDPVEAEVASYLDRRCDSHVRCHP